MFGCFCLFPLLLLLCLALLLVWVVLLWFSMLLDLCGLLRVVVGLCALFWYFVYCLLDTSIGVCCGFTHLVLLVDLSICWLLFVI